MQPFQAADHAAVIAGEVKDTLAGCGGEKKRGKKRKEKKRKRKKKVVDSRAGHMDQHQNFISWIPTRCGHPCLKTALFHDTQVTSLEAKLDLFSSRLRLAGPQQWQRPSSCHTLLGQSPFLLLLCPPSSLCLAQTQLQSVPHAEADACLCCWRPCCAWAA